MWLDVRRCTPVESRVDERREQRRQKASLEMSNADSTHC
jgi:hypothetical protein